MTSLAPESPALAGAFPSVLPASVRRSADDALPLPPPLRGLLPEGVLRRGATLRVSRSTALLLALLGEASRAGAWCASVGLPDLGVVAASDAGVDLDRFALVPAPGQSWSVAAAALLDAIDVVVLAPPERIPAQVARRLSARARERRAVLLVVGESWEGADAELTVVARTWEGVGPGHGHLRGRCLDVRSSGRRVGGRPRTAQLRVGERGVVEQDTRDET